jgi:hypothetical protein
VPEPVVYEIEVIDVVAPRDDGTAGTRAK